MNTIRTRPWREDEDAALIDLIEKHGLKKWRKIGKELRKTFPEQNRSNIQCRERFFNHLRPGLKKGPWHEDEKQYLFFLHKEYANNWSAIGKHMPWRTENAIKSTFHSYIRRKLLLGNPQLQFNIKNLVKDRTITRLLKLDNGKDLDWTDFQESHYLDTWRVSDIYKSR